MIPYNFSFVIPGRVKRGPGIQNRERAALDSGFSYAAQELRKRNREYPYAIALVNGHGESLCVDFFARPDGTFGYEEYRRDVETLEGWFPIGFHSGKLFADLKDAKAAALETVAWLESEM